MKLKLAYLITLILVNYMLISGCSKTSPCGGPEDAYFYLAESEKQLLPYRNGDILNFIRDTGDTLKLTTSSYLDQMITGESLTANPDCQAYNYYQQIYQSFNNYTFAYTISKKYNDRLPSNKYADKDIITVHFAGNDFYISFAKLAFSLGPDYLGDTLISNKLYSKVHRVYKNLNDTSVWILLNKTEGVILFKMPGDTWYQYK